MHHVARLGNPFFVWGLFKPWNVRTNAFQHIGLRAPGCHARSLAYRPSGRSVAGTVLPCGVHHAGRDRRDRLSEQAAALYDAVRGGRRDAQDHCRRSPASRRRTRLPRYPPHLGADADPSPASPLPRPRRRAGRRWIACRRRRFFLPVRVLSRLFRRLFLERLLAAQAAGGLRFFGALAPLGDGNALARALRPLRKKRCRVGGGVTAPPLTDPDVQFSRIRFLMVEFSSRQQMNEQFWLAAADGVSGSR
ncbi:hypothetical protein ABIE78_000433 [Sinorhizobium fredii]